MHEIRTTEKDATLDLVAALDMYEGTFGSEETTIEAVSTTRRDDRIEVELSNGDVFQITVTQLRP